MEMTGGRRGDGKVWGSGINGRVEVFVEMDSYAIALPSPRSSPSGKNGRVT